MNYSKKVWRQLFGMISDLARMTYIFKRRLCRGAEEYAIYNAENLSGWDALTKRFCCIMGNIR